MKRLAAVLRWSAAAILSVAWLVSVVFGYTVSSRDLDTLQRFREQVLRWDRECDFREVCRVYSDLGSAAIRARAAGIPAGDWVLAARSMPGLPPHLANNEGSAAHYRDFQAGPLSAYLHLSDIQGIRDNIERFEVLARTPGLNDELLRRSIEGFNMRRPPTTNPQAVRSVRRMLDDIGLAASDLRIREPPGPLMRQRLASLAEALGVPPRPEDMTPEQQQVVFERLDSYLRDHDRELWRTKQLSDLLSGVWGQSFGFEYLLLIEPMLMLHAVGRVLAPALPLALMAGLALRRPRRPGREVSAPPAGASVVADRKGAWLP